MFNWLYDQKAEPDYEQIVDKSVDLFAVFTGVTFSFYIEDFLVGVKPEETLGLSLTSRIFVVGAVIALLLRYIVGSAVHLKSTYVGKTHPRTGAKKEPASTSLPWLFFDIACLVGFGALATAIANPGSFEMMLWWSAAFVGAGLVWSLIALALRAKERPITKPWIVIDSIQLVLTLGLIYAPWSDGIKAIWFGVIYAVCLYLDFLGISKPKAV